MTGTSRHRWLVLTQLLVVAWLVGACEDERRPRVMVDVSAHEEVSGVAASLQLSVWSAEGQNVFSQAYALSGETPALAFPFGIPLAARDDDATRGFILTAELMDESGAVRARQRLIGGYRGGEDRRRLSFTSACLDQLRCTTQTCEDGMCRAPCRAPETCLELPPPCLARPVRGIAIGPTHGCVLDASRQLWCAGSNRDGRLGLDRQSEASEPDLTRHVRAGPFDQVGVGSEHTYVLSGQTLLCAGSNRRRQLGVGGSDAPNRFNDFIPITQAEGRKLPVRAFALGGEFTCLIGPDDVLYCLGDNTLGQVGSPGGNEVLANPGRTGCAVPWKCTPEEDAVRWLAVTAGQAFACGLRRTGDVWCWGDGARGQLGPSAPTQPARLPVAIDPSTAWTSVSAGANHACGIREGRVLCWGDNRFGQTAPLSTEATVPMPTPLDDASDWSMVAAGATHTCGLHADGRLQCWGSGATGELGGGVGGEGPGPVTVEGTWSNVFAGSQATCAADAAGVASCWGRIDAALPAQGQAASDETAARPRPLCFGY